MSKNGSGKSTLSTQPLLVSTNHAILYENLKPVFAGVDEYIYLDPELEGH